MKRRKHIQNKTIPKHASCLQQGTKVILQKNVQRNELLVLNTKCYAWNNSNTTHYITVPLSIFSSIVVAASCYGHACNRCKSKDRGVFQDKKRNGMELSKAKS